MTGLARVLASPRRRAAVLAAGALALLLLAAAPGELASAAARGATVVVALLAAAVIVGRRAARPFAEPEALRVVASRTLARDAGLALVEVAGRRVLVGFGAGGVRLVSEIAPGSDGGRP